MEKIKDQFSDEEYKTLTADAEKIRAIEEQIATLALADAAASGAAAQGTAFPQFEGQRFERATRWTTVCLRATPLRW